MKFFNKSELDNIEKSIVKYDEEREKLIQLSREIIKKSKVVINNIQRFQKTKTDLDELEVSKKKLDKQIKNITELSHEGMAKVAYQEYAEAKLFFLFDKGEKLSLKEFEIDHEHFLLGICDFTGEVARLAVLNATKKRYDEVKKIKEVIEEAHSFFLKLNLRNSELRKKSDQIKWNLKKVEEILYDISIKAK